MEAYSIRAVLEATDKNFVSTMKQAQGTMGDLDNNTKKTNTSILDIAKGVGVFKLLDVGISAITNSLGSAIQRFDTLNQFPKVLESLGASTEDASSAMQILSDGIDGMPSTLDEVAGTAQQMFLVFRDADKAADSTIALNNALLASGSSGDKATRGTEQYLKILRTGKVELESWGTLQETMGVGLDKIAKSFLGAEASTQDLYNALKSGEITVDQFNKKMIELNEGAGGFAEVAKKSSQGIGTSFKNMRSAVVKGVANIITALDSFVKNAGMNADGIAGIFDNIKNLINTAFKSIVKSIELVTPVFKVLAKATSVLFSALKPLTPLVISLTAAFVAMKVINTITPMITNMNSAVKLSAIALNNYTFATKAGMGAIKAYNAVMVGGNASIKLTTVIMSALTGKITIATAAQLTFAKASTALKVASQGLYAALGPVGVALGILAVAGAALYGIFRIATKDSRELKESQEELSKQMDESTKSYDDRVKKMEVEATATKELSDEIIKLSSKERKSTEDKAKLDSLIQQLNENLEGTALAYDKETDGLNMSNEELTRRIELESKRKEGIAAQERSLELQQQINEADKQLEKAIELQEKDIKNKQRAAEVSGYELSAAQMKSKGVEEAEKNLADLQKQLAEEKKTRDEGLAAEAEAQAMQQHQMVENQKVDYESLSETQKASFDSMQTEYNNLRDTSSNAFDAIEQKTAISLEQMINNLNNNAIAMENWSTNVAILAERGVDQGLIAQLEKMGPAGAAQAAELVKRSDEELKNLSDTYVNNVKTTNEAMVRTAGEGSQPFVDEMSSIADKATLGMKQKFEQSDMYELGKNINQGVASGVSDSTDSVVSSVKSVGELSLDGFRGVFDINSPSRVMAENGRFITEGLSQGIDKGGKTPLSTIKKLATAINDKFDPLPNQLESIGNYSMLGFARGIDSAGSVAIANATRIADSVANAMRKALDIHSPSRVTAKIGEFVGEGLALGMERSAKMVTNASATLSDAATPSISSSFNVSGNAIDFNDSSMSSTIQLNLGGSKWETFVNDIFNTGNRKFRLERSSSR